MIVIVIVVAREVNIANVVVVVVVLLLGCRGAGWCDEGGRHNKGYCSVGCVSGGGDCGEEGDFKTAEAIATKACCCRNVYMYVCM